VPSETSSQDDGRTGLADLGGLHFDHLRHKLNYLDSKTDYLHGR
jgi:hypothetical protein